MRLKKILIFIYICLLLISFSSLMILNILGKKERVGYLGDLNIITSKSYSNNYLYSFKINYYDKIFKHSDIYGVYLLTNSLPEYLKEIRMDNKFGTPFGTLISSKKLEEVKIDNIKYILKVKISIIFLFILLCFLFVIFIYCINDLYILIYDFLNNIRVIYLLKIMFFLIILLFFFLILLNLSIDYLFIFFILLLLFLLIKNVKNVYIIKKYYLITLFLSVLILPMIIYSIFGDFFDKNSYENRVFNEKPNLFLTKIENYTKNYEGYFNDHVPIRNEIIRLKNIIDIYFFKNSLRDEALLGKDDCLFDCWKSYNIMPSYIGTYRISQERLEAIKKRLLYFRDRLKENNIDFILMICPEKHFIYPEYMPDYVKRKNITNSTDIFIEYMRRNTDLDIIYLKDELIKYKNKYILYYKYDAHWNNLSGYIAYQYLMKYMNKDFISLDDAYVKKLNKVNGLPKQISHDLNLGVMKKYQYDVDYLVLKYSTNNIIKYSSSNHNNYMYYESDSKDDRHIFVIRDSFSLVGNFCNYLSLNFKESTFVHKDDFIFDDLLNTSPDIVIYETLERYIEENFYY